MGKKDTSTTEKKKSARLNSELYYYQVLNERDLLELKINLSQIDDNKREPVFNETLLYLGISQPNADPHRVTIHIPDGNRERVLSLLSAQVGTSHDTTDADVRLEILERKTNPNLAQTMHNLIIASTPSKAEARTPKPVREKRIKPKKTIITDDASISTTVAPTKHVAVAQFLRTLGNASAEFGSEKSNDDVLNTLCFIREKMHEVSPPKYTLPQKPETDTTTPKDKKQRLQAISKNALAYAQAKEEAREAFIAMVRETLANSTPENRAARCSALLSDLLKELRPNVAISAERNGYNITLQQPQKTRPGDWKKQTEVISAIIGALLARNESTSPQCVNNCIRIPLPKDAETNAALTQFTSGAVALKVG